MSPPPSDLAAGSVPVVMSHRYSNKLHDNPSFVRKKKKDLVKQGKNNTATPPPFTQGAGS